MGIQQKLFNTELPAVMLDNIKSLIYSGEENNQKLALQLAKSQGVSISSMVNEYCLAKFDKEKIAEDWGECYLNGGTTVNGVFYPVCPSRQGARPYAAFTFTFVGLVVSIVDDSAAVYILAEKDGTTHVEIFISYWEENCVDTMKRLAFKELERFMKDDFYPLIKTL